MSIKALKGRSLSVTLNSSLGSTPLGWCLTEMPDEVMLYYTENTMTAPMSTDQSFHFIIKNTAEKKEVELKFKLVNFTNAEEVEEVVVPVEISDSDSGNAAGSDKFFEFDGNTASYNPNKLVLDYAFPAVGYAYDSCAARPPYGVLPTSASPDCGCVSMMYYMQPQAAFANASYLPAIPYGVFPSNVPYNPSYFYGVMSARNGVDCGNLSMAYYTQACSAFGGQQPRKPYGVVSSSEF